MKMLSVDSFRCRVPPLLVEAQSGEAWIFPAEQGNS
jgi:hypothetical protein